MEYKKAARAYIEADPHAEVSTMREDLRELKTLLLHRAKQTLIFAIPEESP